MVMSDDLPKKLALNLRRLRHARGLSQEQVAQAIGIKRGRFGHLEQARTCADLNFLARCAVFFEVPPEALLSDPLDVQRADVEGVDLLGLATSLYGLSEADARILRDLAAQMVGGARA